MGGPAKPASTHPQCLVYTAVRAKPSSNRGAQDPDRPATRPEPDVSFTGLGPDSGLVKTAPAHVHPYHFESLNLNPQLFVNEVLNTVDDVVDEAFDFFHQEASTKLNSEGSIQRSEDLRKGVDCVRQRIQSVLDNRLAIWEKYCLLHCFAIPQGFRMPITDKSNENGLYPDAPFDLDIDAQLNSLRTRLTEVGKESEVLNREILILEKQSTINAHHINERL
ncbi:hypothetical protein PIB30_088444 [Stylosanthes scabra]|uniref:Protein MIS12 homolog n=1 Tax=Stylosanthes scabra TaxID=79078 RepID=A0ABU6ZSC8_9FABA|nr:hypothetical protein [Stylosanthes scabra]